MGKLLRKPLNERIAPGITFVQDINQANSPLSYVGFRLIEMEKGAIYQEELTDLECCIVALTGKITVSEGDNIFAEIGTRANVFEKIPTDSVFISGGRTFQVKADTEKARVALCYSPANQDLPTTLIKASDNSIEQRGKYQNKRLVHNILPDVSEVASSLLVVEVYTNGGNFSSYPPHKHDRNNLPAESLLEEVIIMKLIRSKVLFFNVSIRMTGRLMKRWLWSIKMRLSFQKAITQLACQMDMIHII